MSINTLIRTIYQPILNKSISHDEAAINYNLGFNRLFYLIFASLWGKEFAMETFPMIKEKIESVQDFKLSIQDSSSKKKNSLSTTDTITFKFEGRSYALKNNEYRTSIILIDISKPNQELYRMDGYNIDDFLLKLETLS